ncbi:hypothetical protein M9Y10_018579 [Tritrichomonas musculus]|uniref:Surface antigen BspA-like n=1 Tax=Tritrichomonas musculus TaxID=1915356 RepID=A0ABR2HMR6_9EUKA
MNKTNCSSSHFDTSKEEKFISEHLSEFIQKEKMLELPIPLLYRVLKLFFESQHNKDELRSGMTDFLFKCLDKYGRSASVLFNLIDFKEQRNELVNRLIKNYLTVFGQNMKVSAIINDKSYFEQEFINNADIIKYQEMFLESITFGQFRRFDDKSKDNFIKGLYKNENEQKNENELLRAKLLLNFSSIPDSYDYYQIVDFLRKNENNQTEFTLAKDKVENLYQMNQLDSCLNNCAIAFNDFIVEIEYPCNKFEQIMKIISDIENQKVQNMKVSVTINDKSYFDQKYECNKIVNICKVGKSVDMIPEEGFSDFSNLSDFELSSNAITIGSSSFKNCNSLTEIKIPTSVKSIGDNCFDGCSKLDQISINPFYTQIQFNTFNKCPSLKHFTISTARESKSKTSEHILIPYNITEIFSQTNFFNSSELTSYINECSEIIFEIEYPSSNFSNIYQKVTDFIQNYSSKIKIGIFNTQIDKYFCNNKVINYVRFSSKRTPNDSIEGSFENCSSLIEIFVPSSFSKIGNRTFFRCSSLKKINFESHSSLTSIGEYVFSGCSSLTQIAIPSSVTSIGHYAFYGCSSLTQIVIPSSVTSIGHYAFYGCSSLTQIAIPSSVTSIGHYAFYGCSSLTQIVIPSSVTSIGHYAFYGCSSLTQIVIPSSVTSPIECTFWGCSSLTQVTIPSSVTLIEQYAFHGCSSLTQITIPSSVTLIGACAFQ